MELLLLVRITFISSSFYLHLILVLPFAIVMVYVYRLAMVER